MPDINDVSESLDILIQGLRQMIGGLRSQTTILVSHSEKLDEIISILTREPDEDTPLTKALKELIRAVEHQSEMLVRIEARLARAPV